jgi:hypothetical protein
MCCERVMDPTLDMLAVELMSDTVKSMQSFYA